MISFPVKFTKPEQASELFKKLDKLVGHGKKNWTVYGRVMTPLKRGKPINTVVLVRETVEPDVLTLIEHEILAVVLSA